MRLSSQRSSSTWRIGTCATARDRPVLRSRIASSRPRLCGMETISGPGISLLRHVIQCSSVSEKRKGCDMASQNAELSWCASVSPLEGRDKCAPVGLRRDAMSLGTIILIILIIALLGGFSGVGGGPFYGTGYYGGGGLGLIIVILLILLLLGKL